MKSLEDFLAHAIALEADSAERFDDLADALEVHFNGPVVKLFRKMAHFSRLHLHDVEKRAAGLTLPHYAPWDFQWPDAEAPETVTHDEAGYQMTPRAALIAALESERRGQAFYLGVKDQTADPEIIALANDFAAEEGTHIALLQQWLETVDDPDPALIDDLDPPNSID